MEYVGSMNVYVGNKGIRGILFWNMYFNIDWYYRVECFEIILYMFVFNNFVNFL